MTTPAQDRAVVALKRYISDRFVRSDDYEFKRFDIQPCGRSVSVVIETGLKGDEGTMASVFGRDRWQIFVGPRGGYSASVRPLRGNNCKVRGLYKCVWEQVKRGYG